VFQGPRSTATLTSTGLPEDGQKSLSLSQSRLGSSKSALLRVAPVQPPNPWTGVEPLTVRVGYVHTHSLRACFAELKVEVHIYDLATSARAIGKGELVSEKSHKEQVGPSLVGLGGPTDKCPKSVCLKQTPTFHYGIGTFIVGGWILQNPSFYGWGALQTYPPEKDLAIAASATLEKGAKVGLNGGQMVFEEIAAALAPGHPPRA
jgi:hypothetical protein